MARRLFCFVNKPPVDLRVCAVITGSLPTADAAFDPERKSLELVLRLGDDIRYGLTDTVPTIITDEDLTWLCDPGEYEMACTVDSDREITLSSYEVNRPGVGMHADATLKVKAMRDGGEGMIEEDLVFPFPFNVLPNEP